MHYFNVFLLLSLLINSNLCNSREIATKVLGHKMLQGYRLKDCQCDQCGMPKMEFESIVLCVVCPVLARKAHKELKKRQKLKEQPSKNPTMTDSSSITCTIEEGEIEDVAKTETTSVDVEDSLVENVLHKMVKDNEEQLHGGEKQLPEKHAEEKMSPGECVKKDIFNNDGHLCLIVAPRAPRTAKEAEDRRVDLATLEKTVLAEARAAKEESMTYTKSETSMPSKQSREAVLKRKQDEKKAEALRSDFLQLIHETKRLETMERMRMAKEIEFKTAEEQSLAVLALQEERKRLHREAKRQKEKQSQAASLVEKSVDMKCADVAKSNVAKSNANEVEIMEAPETAKEKGKKETTSIFKVNASVKEENTEQNYILAEIIAKGEAKTIAEVESIVRSEAEDYHEREVCRSNSQLLRERWELLRVEGKSVMTRRLIAGWKMLPRTCSGKECQKSPLLKKGRIEECVVCGGSGNGVDGVYVETLSLSATSEDGDYDAPVVLSPNNDGREPKAETTSLAPKSVQQIHEDFEVKREKVSKEIGKRMLQGWTLLDMSCPKCVMPLLTDENGENEICVLCGVVGQLSPEDETLPEKASDKKQQKKYDDNSHRDDTSSTFDASKPPNTKEMKQDAFMFEQCKDLKTVWDHEGRQHLDDMQAACTQTKEQLIDFGEMTKEILSKHEDQSPLIQVVSMMSDIPCRPVDLGLGLHDAYDYAEEAINKKPYSRRGVSDPEIQDNSVQQSNDSQSAYGLARMRVSSNDNEVCMVHIKEANAALEESDENSFSQNEDKSVTSVAVLPVDRRGVSDPEIQDNSVQQSNDSQSAYGLTKMRVSSNDDEVCVVQTKEANAAFEESNENSSSQNEDKSVTSVAVLPADSMLPGTSPKEDTPSTKASVSAKAIAPAEFSHTPDKCKVFTRGATATALQMLKSKKADAGTTPKKRLSIDIDAANNRFSPESPRTPAASKTPVPSVSSVSPMPSPRNGRTSSPSPRAKGSPSNYQDLSSKLRTMLSDPVSPRHTPRRFPHSAPSSARIAARDVPDYLISSITGRPISFSGRRISTHDDPPAWSADAATNHRVPQDPETRMLAASSRVASPRTRMAISPVGRPPFVGRSPSPRSTRTPRSFKFPESPVASLSDEIELKSEKEENVMLVIPKNFDITNEAQLRDLIAAVTARQRQASPTTMIAPSPVNSQLAAEGRITNQGSTEIINVIDLELDENNSSYQPLQIDTCSSKLESSQKEAQEALKRAHIASPGEQEVKNTFIVASPQRNNSSLAFSHENTLQHTRRTQRCPPTPESFRKKNVTSSRSISLSRPTRTTDNIEARPNLRSRSIDASSPRIRENSHAATLTPAGSRDSRSYAGASEIRERLNWTFSSSTIHSHYNKTTRNTTGIEPSSSHESTGLPPISPCRGLRKWSDSGNIASSNSSVSSLDVSVHDHHHHHHQQQQQDDSAGQQQQDVSAGHAGAGSFAGSQNSSKSNAKKVSSAFSTSSDVDCIAETLSSAENPITVEDVSVGHTKNGSVAASHQSLVINDKKSPYSFQVSSDVDNMMEEPLSCADNLFTVESLPNIRLQSSGSSKAIEAVFSTPSLPVVRYFEGGSGTSTSYHKSLLENFASTANNPISVEDPKETILPPSSIHVVNSQSYHGVEATGGSTSYHGSTSRSVASTSNDSIRSKQSSNLEAPKDILKALSSSMQNPLSVDEGDSSLALKAVQSSVSSAENPISVEDPKESILPASSIHVVNSQSYGGIEATGGSTSYHGSTSRSVASSGTTSIRSKQSSYLEAPKDILKALSSSMQNPADSTPALNAVQSSASSAENPILVVDEYDIQASSSVAEVEVIHSDVLSVSTANTTTFDGLIRRMDEYKNKLSASSSSSSSAATGTDHKKNNTKMVNLIGKMAAAGVDIETVEEDSVADDEKSITNK